VLLTESAIAPFRKLFERIGVAFGGLGRKPFINRGRVVLQDTTGDKGSNIDTRLPPRISRYSLRPFERLKGRK